MSEPMLVCGRWSKRYINSFDDKRLYDDNCRRRFRFRSEAASKYVERHGCPPLSHAEAEEVRDYWAQHSIAVHDFSWWQMYYAVTGMRDPRFIPDDVAGLVLYAYYNDPAYADAWRDKNMFTRFLPDVRFPRTYGSCIRGRLFFGDVKGCARTDEGIKRFCRYVYESARGECESIIIKDARATGHGRGVKKYRISSEDDIAVAVGEWKGSDHFTVQKCIDQHPVLSALNKESVNVVRVVSWRRDERVDILFAAVRYGVAGAITDMIQRDGIELTNVVKVNPASGSMEGNMIDQDGRVCGSIASGGGGRSRMGRDCVPCEGKPSPAG